MKDKYINLEYPARPRVRWWDWSMMWRALVVALVLAAFFWAALRRTEPPRWQLVRIPNGVVKLDTQTGEAWRSYAGGPWLRVPEAAFDPSRPFVVED